MDHYTTREKNSGRVERRDAYTICDIDWLYGKENWAKLARIEAIHTRFTTKKGTTGEWHFALNAIRSCRDKPKSKLPLSKLMFDCLLDSQNILSVLAASQN